MELLFASVAFAVGIVATYIYLRTRIAVSAERIQNLEKRLAESQAAQQKLTTDIAAKGDSLLAISNELSAATAGLAKEREAAVEKIALVQQAQQSFSESFDLLAARALKENTAEF